MGMIGVGAASFVAVQPEAEDEDAMINHTEDDSDLLNEPKVEVQVDNDEIDSVNGTLHAGLLDDVHFSSEENSESAASQTIAAEPGNAEDVSNDDETFDFSVYDGPEFTNFMTGDWINQANGPEVIDYEATNESILVVWDDTDFDAREPSLSVSPDPDDPEVMQVNMNGKVVADVYGDSDLSVADLTLMPLSSALIVGLSPA